MQHVQVFLRVLSAVFFSFFTVLRGLKRFIIAPYVKWLFLLQGRPFATYEGGCCGNKNKANHPTEEDLRLRNKHQKGKTLDECLKGRYDNRELILGSLDSILQS